jgi:Ca2+-binding RTX toxin-like protein
MNFIGTSGDDDYAGTPDNDVFDMTQGGNDTIRGDDGNDNIFFGNTYTAADRVFGGAGTDLVGLSGSYAAPITVAHMFGVETLEVVAGSFDIATVDTVVAAGKFFQIAAASLTAAQSLTFDGSAETDGHFNVFLGAGDDVVTGGVLGDNFSLVNGGDDTAFGGDGNDNFFLGNTLTIDDHIDGGSGPDIVQLNGDYSSRLVMHKNTLVSIETLQLISGHTYNLVMHDNTVSAAALLFVSGPSGGGDLLKFDGSAETDGAFSIRASAGDDRLIGGAGSDFFVGRAGADVLDGRGGADEFIYETVSESTSNTYDRIIGFDADEDFIAVGPVIFDIDPAVNAGRLSGAHFDRMLAHAIGATELDNSNAVLFTPNKGTLAGHTFLIIDANNTDGYQASVDIVIELANADLANFSVANII